MAGAVVRVFDHDCPWIGGPVGAGNHRAFMSLLVCGVAALLLHVAEVHTVEPDGLPLHWAPLAFSLAETAEATSARLLIARALVAIALRVAIRFLLYTQLTAVVDGVTTAEVMRWQRANMSALSGMIDTLLDGFKGEGPAPINSLHIALSAPTADGAGAEAHDGHRVETVQEVFRLHELHVLK